MLIFLVLQGCEMTDFNGRYLKDNSMLTMSFMHKALLKCIEYLWVHSIAESGRKRPVESKLG
jgi:hypothetical protein